MCVFPTASKVKGLSRQNEILPPKSAKWLLHFLIKHNQKKPFLQT